MLTVKGSSTKLPKGLDAVWDAGVGRLQPFVPRAHRFLRRAERIVGIGGAALIVGAGPGGLVLSSIVAVLSLLSAITIGQRIVHIYSITEGAQARRGNDDATGALDTIAKGS